MVKTHPRVKAFLDEAGRARVTEAVDRAEHTAGVEFRVAILQSAEPDLTKLARRVYRRLNIARARRRHGILFLILPVRRKLVLFGDDEANRVLAKAGWQEAQEVATIAFKEGRNAEGIADVLDLLSEKLTRHFPPLKGKAAEADELPDEPVQLEASPKRRKAKASPKDE